MSDPASDHDQPAAVAQPQEPTAAPDPESPAETELATEAESAAEAQAPARSCSVCGEAAYAEDKWCEACGADLDGPTEPAGPAADAAPSEPAYVPTGPCVSCGADMAEITDDGWCQLCGTKQPNPGDHVVDDQGIVAVVSDRGRKHRVNEDSGAAGFNDDVVALIVCDGVSSTDDSQQASQAAIDAALGVLLDPTMPAGARLVAAASASQQAVVAATPPAAAVPPSCTFVAAIADISGATNEAVTVTTGWLGDSRAYWIDADGARQLTQDHTWAIEQQQIGAMADDEIAADERAHSITRWLGADAIDVTPEVVALTITEPGLLLVCSDGLWNYVAEPAEMAALVAEHDADKPELIDLAERLVSFAIEAGGHDNITVAVARFPFEPPAARPDTADANTADPIPADHEPTESNDPTGS